MGAASLKRLAQAGRTVGVEVDGETVVFNVPLGDDGKELVNDVLEWTESSYGPDADEARKARLRVGMDLIGKWAPRLIDGADQLTADELEYIVLRIGYLRCMRTLRTCAGAQLRADDLSPDRSGRRPTTERPNGS